MPRSSWKLNIDASTELGAKKVINRCIKSLGRPPVESRIEKYTKGGYMATLEFYHHDKLSWPEIVFEVISFGESLGVGWVLMGNIACDPSAVLSKESTAKISVPGLVWAEWQVSSEKDA